ncbi:MAG: hypothetical protein U1F26_15225 [Lysobacterales bacterium]
MLCPVSGFKIGALRAMVGGMLLWLAGSTSAIAAACTWQVNGPGAWDLGSNWGSCGGSGPNGSPGSADDVIIGPGTPNAEVQLGADRSVRSLSLSQGRITGNASLTILTNLNWTGGAIEGVSALSDQLIVNGGATGSLDGVSKTLRSRKLVNNGSLSWSNGDFLLFADAEFENRGVLTATMGATVTLRMRSDASPAARLHNVAVPGATLVVNGAGNLDLADNITFDNGSDVLVQNGALRVESPGGDFGQYQVSAAASLVFAPAFGVTRDLTGSSAVSGSGRLKMRGAGELLISGGYSLSGEVEVSDGRLAFNTPAASISLSDLVVIAPGRLDGGDDFQISNTLTWQGGEIRSPDSSSQLTLQSGAVATMTLTDPRPFATLSARRLVNQGTWRVNSNASVNTVWYLDAGVVIDNQSVLEFNNAGTQEFRLSCTLADCASFLNAATGSVRFDSNPGLLAIDASLGSFDNAGSVQLIQGCAAIDAPGTDTGAYTLNGTCTLAFFTRAGSERIFQPSVVLNQTGAQLQLEGRLRVNGTGRAFSNVLINPGAILYGPAVISITGTALWRGTIEGTGTGQRVVITSTGILQTTPNIGDTPTLRDRLIVVQGGMVNDQADIELEGDAAISMLAGNFSLYATPGRGASVGCAVAPPCGSISVDAPARLSTTGPNGGPLIRIKSGLPVTLNGSLEINGGTLSVEDALTTSATAAVLLSSGGVLSRAAGPLTLNGSLLAGDGAVQGDVVSLGGTLEPGDLIGPLSISGNFSADAATTYTMEVAGNIVRSPRGGNFDRLIISGTAALNGTLNVIDAGYTPSPGDVFDFVTYASRTGTITLGVNPYSGFSLIHQATRVRLAQAAATTCTWNGSTGPWSDPARWVDCSAAVGPPGGTPGPAETAVITAGTVTLDFPVVVGGLDMTGGVLNGANDLNIVNSFNWTGGRIEAPAGPAQTLILQTGASALLSGGQKVLDRRQFGINGSLIWTTGLIELANGAGIQISPTGELRSNPGVAFEEIQGTGVGTAQVSNNGGIVKIGTRGSGLAATVQYVGAGTVLVDGGKFRFAGGGTYNDAYTVNAGADLEFVHANRSFSGGSFAGAGKFVFGDASGVVSGNTVSSCFLPGTNVAIRDAVLTVNCSTPTTWAALALERDAAVLQGSSAIEVSNQLHWSSGRIAGASTAQTFTLANGASALFDGPGPLPMSRVLDNRRFDNHGAILISNGNWTAIDNGAQLTNHTDGQIVVNAQPTDTSSWSSNTPASSLFTNAGLLQLVQVNDSVINPRFVNTGTVNITQGTLWLTQGGTDTGTYTVSASGTLVIDGLDANRTLATVGAINGLGRLNLFNSSVLNTQGVLSVAEVNVGGGSDLVLQSTTPVSLDKVGLTGGTISGSAEVRIKNQMSWSTGTISGNGPTPGPFRILPGGVLDAIGDVTRSLQRRALQIEGTLNYHEGELNTPAGEIGVIDVRGSGLLLFNGTAGASAMQCSGGPCTLTIQNTGTIRRNTTAVVQLNLSAPLSNAGTVELLAANTQIAGLTQSTGQTVIAAGASLESPLVTLTGGTLSGSGQIIGDLNNTGGTVRPQLPGVLSLSGNYTQGAGATLEIEVGGTSPGINSDQLSVGGAVTSGGTLTVVDLGVTLTPPASVPLVHAMGGVSGSYASTTVPFPGYGIDYQPTDIVLAPLGAPIVVNAVADPGTGSCDPAECTLREAINQANSVAGPDTIVFNIPGAQCTGPGGSCIIAPATPLPAISSALVIDGYTQPGASPNTQAPGLGLGSNAVLKIEIDGAALGGTPALNLNATGVSVLVSGLAIYRAGSAIQTQGPADGLYTIAGNFLGLRADGSAAPAGQNVGVSIQGGRVEVGLANAAGMNVISGNAAQGIAISTLPPFSGALIRGNLIGTTPNGLSARPNGLQGIIASTPSRLIGISIGGAQADARNVISGNLQDGIRFDCSATSDQCFDTGSVSGNYIGLAANGSALGNGGNGVHISSMDAGLLLIGGTGAGEGNHIAYNGAAGIRATHGGVGRVSFLANAISNNGALAIDLGGDGRTANDPSDADTGPNGRQNFPGFSAYTLAPSFDAADFTFNIDSVNTGSNYPMRVDFYRAIEDEPGQWLGSTSCATSACSASISFPPAVTLTSSDIVLGVVTDANGKSSEASFYATTLTITGDSPDPSTIGTQYTVTVTATSTDPFAPLGTINVLDTAGNGCAGSLTRVSNGNSTASCAVNTTGAPGAVTISASYAPGALYPFVSATDTEPHNYAAATVSTLTSITSVSPQPVVVGQPYTVSVSVLAGGSPVPAGAVEVRQLHDGASCVISPPATSCQLSSASALTTAVRASYLGAAGYAPSTSALATQLINRADTRVQILNDTPDPSQVGGEIAVSVAVSVVTPGAGTPSGNLLITDGSASCLIALPSSTCSFVPKLLGTVQLEARYLGDANFNPSIGTEAHTIIAEGADLAIIKRNGLRLLPAGQPSSYVIVVSNQGPQAVVNARVTDILPAQLSNASWTCSASAGASCPESGSGTVDALVSLQAGASATFTLTATAQAAPEQIVTNRATVTAPVNAPDPQLGNNESVDTDPIGLFGEGFESESE